MTHHAAGSAPVTVVLPTIGRPELVGACLGSLARCNPRADEIVVVDSSRDGEVGRVVSDFADVGARAVRCDELGLGMAFNVGLRVARHEFVLFTNDDCTADPGWVGAGLAHITASSGAIVTGRVRPDGDPRVVPSTIDDPMPREYIGKAGFVLYTQSMAVRRSELLEFGGFDGRIRPSAEDNDLSYRWLRAGRRIRYAPDFAVLHRDWRTREQLDRLYVGYGIGQGMVYAKHLLQGDIAIARYVLRDLYAGCRGLAARILRGRSTNADWRIGLLRGLPIGVARGILAGRAPAGGVSE